jgi:3-dehydroquinate synthase
VEIISVGLDERSYKIHIDTGNLLQLGELCRQVSLKGRVALITNPVVAALYLTPVQASLEAAGYLVNVIEIPDGEEYKNAKTLETIYDRLIEAGFDRSGFLVALGGGVVGDIAGYAAATFLRGVPFVQVPTTLLAQVDSSVGGKTGINHSRGKNLIGAFYQPRLVLIDLNTLDTLPEREYLCGLAEALKYGIVLERDLFEFISSGVSEIKGRNKTLLRHIVAASCRIKADVVHKDEKECGVRAVLNYGHTIGHAVETLAGYGTIRHGEAVAIGMAQAARLSEARGFSSATDRERIVTLLKSLGFSVDVPDFPLDQYLEIIGHDKKKRDDGVNFIFNRGIGAFVIENVTDLVGLLSTIRQ